MNPPSPEPADHQKPEGVPVGYGPLDFLRENGAVESTIPLPPEPGAPTLIVEPEHRERLKVRVERFFHQRPWAVWVLASVGLLFVLATISAYELHQHYQARAAKYDLNWVTHLEEGSVALDVKGKPLGQVALEDRRIIDFKSVPPHLVDALIATEDNRFYEHHGIDGYGIMRAFVANLKAGRIAQGGSTITQQLARHSFNLSGRTYERKALEIYLAKRVEDRFTKREILNHYLNRIYLGSGYWGVEAASRGYFGKSTEELDLSEAATLCAIIKSPNRFSPARDLEAATAARNRTLQSMFRLGMIDETTLNDATSVKLAIVPESERSTRPDYLLAAIRREANEVLGPYHELDGLTIHTSVDRDLQRRVMSILDRQLSAIEREPSYSHTAKASFGMAGPRPDYLQGAAVIIENRTGRVIASVGGRDFSDSEFDRVWSAKRKPGMTIVPLLYAYAFETKKVLPFDLVLDAPIDNREVMIGGTAGVLGEWGAESTTNDYEGKVRALYAMIANKSAASVRVGQKVGLESFGAFLEGLEFKSGTTGYPNSFLGEAPARLVDLVRAYTIFANGGKLAPASRLVTKIEDSDGSVLYSAETASPDPQMILPETAALIDQALGKVMELDPVRAFSPTDRESRNLRGRNGSSYGFEDTWFVGYDNEYTWGVWMGFDHPEPIAPEAFSVRTAMPAWLEIARGLGEDEPSFTTEAPRPANTTHICLLSGQPAGPACAHTRIGDLTIPVAAAPGGTLCPVHQSAADGPRGQWTRTAFPGVRPVKPKVAVVEGGNPWGGKLTQGGGTR